MISERSVITGRITDEFGEPMAGVMVQASRYQFRPSGQRQLMSGGFGNFTIRRKAPRPGRNPRTGEAIPITARNVVTFHASHKLKSLVQGETPSAEDFE